MRRNCRAFTLVEIMIVTAIIALLAAIAIPNLYRARVQANESAAQAALKSISTALENYAALNNVYPTNTSDLISAAPPYLTRDYFNNTYSGYQFNATLGSYSYTVTAAPISAGAGNNSYSITTGGVMQTL